jgi:cobalt-zinc-cadmium efflux system membrane fusion protein
VNIYTQEGDSTVAVPSDAIVYEGNSAHLWVMRDDNSVQYRKIKIGVNEGGLVQILEGLSAGERVVTKGSLFVDRASGN